MNKKKTEEKEIQKPNPQEISFKVEGGKVIFETKGDGPLFWMSAENFLKLLNPDFTKKKVEQEEAGPDLTLEQFCLVKRLQYKGLNFPQISKVIGMPLEQLTGSHQRFKNGLPETLDGRECQQVLDEIERQRTDKDEMDFVKTLPIKDNSGNVVFPAGQKLIDIEYLHRLEKQNKNLKEIAANLNLDLEDLRKFNSKNHKYERYMS